MEEDLYIEISILFATNHDFQNESGQANDALVLWFIRIKTLPRTDVYKWAYISIISSLCVTIDRTPYNMQIDMIINRDSNI